MLKFNFLLFGSAGVKKKELIKNFAGTTPGIKQEDVVTHEILYKDLLPVTTNFLLGDTPATSKSLVEKYEGAHNLLFVFDVASASSFRILTPEVIDEVAQICHTNRPILVGFDATGSASGRVSRDEILAFAQKCDVYYYFEITPDGKYDFRTLVKKLLKENMDDFRQQQPDIYQEAVKEARRAKMEAEKARQALEAANADQGNKDT